MIRSEKDKESGSSTADQEGGGVGSGVGATAQRAAAQTMQAVKDKAGEARDAARQLLDDAREQAAAAGQKIKETGQGFIDQRRERAAEEVGHLAAGLRQTADQLREKHGDYVAGYADMIAERVESVEQYLDSHSFSDMLGGVERFARRRPEIFIGGLFLAGLITARLLKASSEHRYASDIEIANVNPYEKARRGGRSRSRKQGQGKPRAGGIEHVE